MKDERPAPAGAFGDAAAQRQETEESRPPDGESSWDIDDILWDAFSSGLSAAYD